MKNLPIGIQDFPDFLERDYIYVDKTPLIHRLITTGKYYFLSRPRRFGKSLLISTFKELFKGNQKLFKNLWIEDKWDWTKTYPVIHLSFDKMNYKSLGLEKAIINELAKWAEQYDITFSTQDYVSQFDELLRKVSHKYGKVALLIDEYDKPIIDFLEHAHKGDYTQANANQAIMKNFYSILKSSGEHLHFFFITGVSKFSKISVFSDLNHLQDLTLHPDYTTLVGYTQAELEFYFADYIQGAATHLNMSREDLLQQMQIWYNGFSWDGKTKVYNPFGVLNFLAQKWFNNFWFSTGTPTFLFNMMKKHNVYGAHL